MTDYVPQISGPSLEIVLQSLTSAQAEYWKEKSKEELEDYVFSRTKDEFVNVPQAAHIEGSWENPDELWRGFGPLDAAECVLLEIGEEGKEVELWKGYLDELQREQYTIPQEQIKAKWKSEYVLVMEADDRGGVDYRWNEVSKKPTPSDFCLTYSPGGDILIDVTLFGKKAEFCDDSFKNSGLEARVDLASRFGIENPH